MDNYTLYLDESTTSDAGRKPTFVIAGIIIKDEYHDSIFTDALNHVKSIIWSDIAGLQIADFLPNQIGKKVMGISLFANTQDFNNNIFRKAYNGNVNNKKRYGIKSILQD